MMGWNGKVDLFKVLVNNFFLQAPEPPKPSLADLASRVVAKPKIEKDEKETQV